MSDPGTAPNRRLSTAPAAGLSDSSHQPPPAWRAARFTSSISGRSGLPGDHDLAGADPAVRRISRQSPGRRAGSMDRSVTLARQMGQCTHPSKCRRRRRG